MKKIIKTWFILSFVLAPILGKIATLEDDDELTSS